MLPSMKSTLLSANFGIDHAFFTRCGGVSRGIYDSLNGGLGSADDKHAVRENRRRIAASMGVAHDYLISCRQVHSARVVIVDSPWSEDARPEADAMVTKVAGIALGVLSADCVPLLLADEEAAIIGAAHAGWRGALSGVVANTVAAMVGLGAFPQRITAALGPAISGASYQVSADFMPPFIAQHPDNKRFFSTSPTDGGFLFDLPAYVMSQLAASGVVNVSPSCADTYTNDARFFSWRRSCKLGFDKVGSLVSAITIKPRAA